MSEQDNDKYPTLTLFLQIFILLTLTVLVLRANHPCLVMFGVVCWSAILAESIRKGADHE